MTRSELVERLASRQSLTPGDANIVVQEILGAIANALGAGRRIEIRGFGSFSLSHVSPKAGRNPKTGESILVPAKMRLRFKAGKELKTRLVEPR